MAIQYSISYDDKGNPSLVKNTIEGSKPVVKTSFNIGEYKPVRTIQTDFDFDNMNNETVYQSLQKYIYQTETNSDASPKEQSEQNAFLEQSFKAAAARDKDGKVIGGSTFKEKAKMAAVNTYVESKLNPIKSALISQVPVIGTIHKALTYAGSQYVDPYYDPLHENYYYTGFGGESVKGASVVEERMQKAGGVKIDDAYIYATDYPGDTVPSDVNAGAKALAQTYHAIGRTRDRDDSGSSGHAGGSSAAEAAASQASDDVAAGLGGY